MPRNWTLPQDSLKFVYQPRERKVNEYGLPVSIITMDTSKNLVPANLVFAFNPNQVDVSYRKAKVIVPTKSGFVTQYWFNQMHTFNFKGSTEPFIGPTGAVFNGELDGFINATNSGVPTNLKDTPQWRMFWLLDQFIQTANADIMMIYDGATYYGGFDGFQYNENADDPFAINYSFSFQAYPYQYSSGTLQTNRWTTQMHRGFSVVDATNDAKYKVEQDNLAAWDTLLNNMMEDLSAFRPTAVTGAGS